MSKIRIGIIGTGGRGSGFLHRILDAHADEAEIVALADVNPVRMQAARRKAGVDCACFTDAGGLLNLDSVDAVIVTTPDYLHEQYAVAALEAGRHVFVDKPLATSVKGCLRILDTANRADKLVYMGFNMRFDPVVRRVKSLVDAGELGDVFRVEAQEFYDGGRTYMARWNRLSKFSGGLWIHKGSHDFDVINWLMGRRPKRVSAFAAVNNLHPAGLPFEVPEGETFGPRCGKCEQFARCPDRSELPEGFREDAIAEDGYARDLCIYQSDKDTHDQGVSIVEFEDGRTAVHSECFVTSYSNRLYTVVGNRGTLHADLGDNSVVLRPRWSQDVVTRSVSRGRGGHGGADPVMIANYLACIRGEEEPLSSIADGVWAVAEGQAAELSVAERRTVEISELLDPANPLLQA